MQFFTKTMQYNCCREPKIVSNSRLLRNSGDREKDVVPEGAKVIHSLGRKFLLRKENFDDDGVDEDAHYEKMYSDFQHRNLQNTIHEENYADLPWFPFEWLIKVGTEYYFRYEGTMLEPPCWEVVHWRVVKDPIRVHKRQISELTRLLAWRKNPEKCFDDTAGIVSNNGNAVDVARSTMYLHNQHRMVFCECKDWPSKAPGDAEWCRGWKLDTAYTRFYQRPYSFETNGQWLPSA
jgi:hypothetical protein